MASRIYNAALKAIVDGTIDIRSALLIEPMKFLLSRKRHFHAVGLPLSLTKPIGLLQSRV